MKVEVLMNGTTKIVLIPENEIEVAIIKAIVANGDVHAISITQPTQILDKVIQDGLVISEKALDKTFKSE